MLRFNYSQAKEVLSAFACVESGFSFNVYHLSEFYGDDIDVEVYSHQEESTILVFTISKFCFGRLKSYGFTFNYISK